jgi:two-component system response regulator
MVAQKEPNILLVEDTEEHAVLMKRALEDGKLNPHLFAVTDGQAALDFLYNQGDYADKEANPKPDLILLDLKLPKVSGLQILKKVKDEERLKDIPVVVLTASDEGSDIIRSYQGGAESYLTKSVLFLNKGADPTAILDTVMSLAGV